jgi:hypothetical protein
MTMANPVKRSALLIVLSVALSSNAVACEPKPLNDTDESFALATAKRNDTPRRRRCTRPQTTPSLADIIVIPAQAGNLGVWMPASAGMTGYGRGELPV